MELPRRDEPASEFSVPGPPGEPAQRWQDCSVLCQCSTARQSLGGSWLSWSVCLSWSVLLIAVLPRAILGARCHA